MWNRHDDFFESVLFNSLGESASVKEIKLLAGGFTHNAVQIHSTAGIYFLKWAENKPLELFSTEFQNLVVLKEADAVRVPAPVNAGRINERSYLLQEYLDQEVPAAHYWENFGRSMAELHHHTQQQNGLSFNNYLNVLEQNNEELPNWPSFFIENRLRVQFGRAYYNGLIDKEFLEKLSQLQKKIHNLLPNEKPSLLHGDFWNGNTICTDKGEVALINPACYYGHREVDLACSRLFSTFPQEFYDAYTEASPLATDHADRVAIYNMYPLMAQANLWGSSYLNAIRATLDYYCD